MQPKRREGSVIPVTETISPDEKCDRLLELNKLTADNKHLRRWQMIYVNRGGERHVYVHDMGPAERFGPELCVVSEWEDSVAYCQEQANRMRFENSLAQFLAEKAAESTLVDDWWRMKFELWEQKHNRSHFGPVFSKQRNAFVRR